MSDVADLVTVLKPYVRNIYELGFSLFMLFLVLKFTGLWDKFAPAALKAKANGKDSNGKDSNGKASQGGISIDALAEQMHSRFGGVFESMEGLGRRLEQVRSQTERLPNLQSTMDQLKGRVKILLQHPRRPQPRFRPAALR